jgi:hypothetical protein
MRTLQGEIIIEKSGYAVLAGVIGMAAASSPSGLSPNVGFTLGFAITYVTLIALEVLARKVNDKKANMEKIIEFLVKHITVSEDDALVAGIFALGGFVADALFFPQGMQPLTVTILSGASGLLLYKVVEKSQIFSRTIAQQH